MQFCSTTLAAGLDVMGTLAIFGKVPPKVVDFGWLLVYNCVYKIRACSCCVATPSLSLLVKVVAVSI